MATMNPAGAPGGVIYEPRSLWSVQNIDTTPYNNDPNLGENNVLQYVYQKFDRENFRNGTRYPITITRFAMVMLNYLYAVNPDTFVQPVGGAPLVDSAQQALNRARFRISVPGRQNYSRFELSVPSYGIKPTWAEPVSSPPTPRANTFGLVRLNYDRPLFLPRQCALELQLSSPSDLSYAPAGAVTIPNVFGSAGLTSVPAEVIFMEEGGLTPGSARSKQFPLMLSQSPNQAPGQNGYPYAIPPYFAPATVDNKIPFWHRPQTFSAVEFRKQEGTRAGSNMDLGCSIALNQFDYDSVLIDTFGNTGKIAPLSTRVGSRVRSVDFGSGADWWRPGAPLALTFDTVTPALVVMLPQPVTLQPGDTFEVEAQVPGPFYTAGFVGEQNNVQQNAPNYALGISFNGYAAITG